MGLESYALGIGLDIAQGAGNLALMQKQFISAGVTQVKDLAQQKLVRVIDHDDANT